MTKKIDILGVSLDNYSVREAMHKVDEYLDNQELNTIEKVSAKMLIDSEQDPVLKSMIAGLDLALIGDSDILKVAGIDTMQRIKETEENDFFFAFFDRLQKNARTVFLLAHSAEQLEASRNKMKELFPKLIFSGEYALDECKGDQDAVINEINAATPDVILSMISSPVQEHFFMEHKDKMDANIWYGMGSIDSNLNKRGVVAVLMGFIHRGRLKSSIEKYHEN